MLCYMSVFADNRLGEKEIRESFDETNRFSNNQDTERTRKWIRTTTRSRAAKCS